MTDREIYIAVANSRSAVKWKNRKTTWLALAEKCSRTTRTGETFAEYKAMTKTEQSNRKDVGGFVGGYLRDGKRSKGNVEFRDVLTLDIDFCKTDTWDTFCLMFNWASFAYSTHNHTTPMPRIRLVILLGRSVTDEEYEALGRAVAAKIDIELMDDTTYQPERLMYWPSTSTDGDWFYDRQDGPALDPDEILATYHNWQDTSEWPYSSRVTEAIRSSAVRQGDPTLKQGIVGAFCRTYDIHSVIEKYLSDVYEPTDTENRYTFKQGTVAAGLVVYENGKFAYSHNATDPSSQHLCNAFDLVRMHKFLQLDEHCDSSTTINNRPSYRAMSELSVQDTAVRRLLTEDRRASAISDFQNLILGEEVEEKRDEDTSWMDHLEYSAKGKILNTITNASIVLEYAPEFRGALWHDDFSGLDRYDGRLPWSKGKVSGAWSNADDAALRMHLESTYGISGKERIADALTTVMLRHHRHPIRDYLRSLSWDGVARLDTLLIDFLGAEDSQLLRLQTRKQFVAAVERVMHPGCKYDYMLVLVGEEGIGKSTLLRLMAGQWFNDSISNFDGKEGMENLQRAWIIEVGELMGIKRSEVESVKAYLSKQIDTYRPAYGRVVEERPRQCVFFGTTNEKNFLKGGTGNRRFWIVETGKQLPRMDVFHELTAEYRDQVWAEAVYFADKGEELYLEPSMEKEARQIQDEYNELSADERIGVIAKFLDTPLPADWDSRSLDQRKAYFRVTDPISAETKTLRNTISAVEILAECFGTVLDEKARYKTREINQLMRHVSGWKPAGKQTLPVYGQQRIYKRINQPKQEEEL